MSIEQEISTDQAPNPENALTEQEQPAATQDRPRGIEVLILDRLRTLPTERKRQVLDFVEFLAQKKEKKLPLRDPAGLWADFDIHITEEDIADARREMWGGNLVREEAK